MTVTNNNVEVTKDLEEHYTGGTPTSYSTASGSGVTTGFARSGGAFYQSSSTSSDSWLRYSIGKTAKVHILLLIQVIYIIRMILKMRPLKGG